MLGKEKRCLFCPCLKFHYHVQRKHLFPTSERPHKLCKLRDGCYVREVINTLYFPTKCVYSRPESGTPKLCLRCGSFSRKLKD